MKSPFALAVFANAKLADFRRFKERERRYYDPGASLGEKLWLWRNGFCSLHKKLYGLTKQNVQQYLDDSSYRKLHPINGDYSALIDNKAFLPLLISEVPKVHVVVVEGSVRHIRIGGHEYREALFDHLHDFVRVDHQQLVGKPLNSSGGDGFFLIDNATMQVTIEQLMAKRASFIINERVKQHEYASGIFEKTLNTVRVVLMRDPADRQLFVARAFHRFGTERSSPVDNAAKGGLVVPIELATGRLGKGLVYKRPQFGWHSRHPDTGRPVEGIVIPTWVSILSEIVRSFDSLHWFDYGGLDVVVLPSGYLILEVNSLPDPEPLQITEPLLADPRIRAFYEAKGLRPKGTMTSQPEVKRQQSARSANRFVGPPNGV